MEPVCTRTYRGGFFSAFFEDIKAKAEWNYGKGTYKNICRALFSDGTLSMFLFRLMWVCNRWALTKPAGFMLCKMNTLLCGAVIGHNAEFEPPFVILHSVGIVVNSKVRGGRHIVLESGVVIGEEKGQCPSLGNHIFVGSGAKIFGGISIGDNVDIGANAVVCKDFPDNMVVAGVPAAIIRHK